MTKLGSYMVGGAFTPTQFYAEVDGHPDDPGLARALEELAFLSRELLTLGVYGVAVPGRKRQFQVGTSSPGIFGGQLVVLQTGYTLRTCATCLSPLVAASGLVPWDRVFAQITAQGGFDVIAAQLKLLDAAFRGSRHRVNFSLGEPVVS